MKKSVKNLIMRFLIIILVCFSIAFFQKGAAQNQIQVYKQQIAANKVYIDYLKKGYRIIDQGMSAIGNIKNGHLNIDQFFFERLVTIHPALTAHIRKLDMETVSKNIFRSNSQFMKMVQSSPHLSPTEKRYIRYVLQNIKTDHEGELTELKKIASANDYKMDEAERIARVNQLYEQIQKTAGFQKNFLSSAQLLLLQRSRENQDFKKMKSLYE